MRQILHFLSSGSILDRTFLCHASDSVPVIDFEDWRICENPANDQHVKNAQFYK